MNATGRAGVLFDVDGTLIDSNYLHALAWARAFAEHGRWASTNSIHRLVGQGGDQLVARLLGRDDPPIRESRTRRYQELQNEARVFPGAVALLRAVHDLGLAVVLATSSPADELEATRKLLDCDDCIDAATTANLGCLAVETGGFSHHELSEAGALHVYRDVEQLYSWLQTSAIALLA